MRWPWQRQEVETGDSVSVEKPKREFIRTSTIEPIFSAQSDTWLYIKTFLEREIQSLRERNDKLSIDAGMTTAIRGQIKMAKRILDLEKTGPGGANTRSERYGTEDFGPVRR